MTILRYAILVFVAIDATIFVTSQVAPETLRQLMPQFDTETGGDAYLRAVGMMFLALGLMRLYGSLFITNKRAFQLALYSWAIELLFTVTELARGASFFSASIAPILVVSGMLIWSCIYYQRHFAAASAR